MALAIQVLELAPTVSVIAGADEMGGVMVAEDGQRLFELVLFDVAVGGQVATCGASRDQVFSRQEGQRAGVIVVGKMDLSEPESVGVTI